MALARAAWGFDSLGRFARRGAARRSHVNDGRRRAWCGHLCRVKANQGAVVRAGRALDSELIGELPTGAEVRVWESGFHLKQDGTKIGRGRVTEPLNGWLSAKCVEVLPQGVRGGPVPRCDDYEACFEPAEPQRVAKKDDGPPKTYVPASIAASC